MYITFQEISILMSTIIEVNTVLLYDFLHMNDSILLSKDFLTSFHKSFLYLM